MSYLHIDILSKQSSKIPGNPCGDVIGYERNNISTTLILSDGLGSGIKANIAANMCVSRGLELIRNGASLKDTFSSLVKTMNNAWGTDNPFAVFSIARILRNGETSILSYESPQPVLVNHYSGNILKSKVSTLGKAIIYESHCVLKIGEGILLVSDGITQAGLGNGLNNGWEIKGVSSYITDKLLNKKAGIKDVPHLVHDRARELWRQSKGDDCSVALAKCRQGVVLNIFSGPPADKKNDASFVKEFMDAEGIKIVCGGSSAKIVARELGQELKIKENTGNNISPPEYEIKGINYVTEGAVTLNQAYNIIDEDIDDYKNNSGVFVLVDFLKIADKINFWIGKSKNEGFHNIAFKQQHILDRHKITHLLIEKLKQKGKLIIENTK